MSMQKFDAVVIGSGPGGYPCAIRMAQLGLRVAIVEEAELGGECLNYGCIPSKAIIQLSDLFHRAEEAVKNGIASGSVAPDMKGIQQFRKNVVGRMTRGVETLLKGNAVTVIRGRGKIAGKGMVEAAGETLECGSVVLATGSTFIELPSIKFDHKSILDVRDLLSIEHTPSSLLVVGGGFIGLEMGVAFAKLGTAVTVVEMMPQVMPGIEQDVLRVVERRLKSLGIRVMTSSTVEKCERGEGTMRSTVRGPDGTAAVESELVLVSVGKRSSAAATGLEKHGVAVDGKGFVIVDERCRTNVPWIYAVGDVTGPPFLAHRATAMGKVAAECIAGLPSAMEQRVMPNAVFTDPEIATAGMTQSEAEKEGIEVKTGKFPFTASGRATTLGDTEGFVRIVARKDDGTVIGCQIVGREASELISEAALAIEMGATLEDIALTIHPHPTLPEALMEAAEAADKRATHFIVR